MTKPSWSKREMLIVYSNFWIHGILLGSGLLDPRNLDPRYLDPGNLDPGNPDLENLAPGNLYSGHRPGRWLWRRKKGTAALLVKRTSAAVSALQYKP